ncbi:MAG TPA: MFS transporter [Vicinamibacterales bacterium]|nr:MFS transporter [Vicinamibacterales bacterium]
MDGLYLLWWTQEKGMSPALVAATMAAGDLALMALEVPTGWFADRFGSRRSLILGSILQVAGMTCCWLADGVPGLIGACLLVALADAFRSGADHSLLYRTCIALDRESEFQRIEARSRAVQVVVLAALTVAGGAVVSTWGFAAGWLAETTLCAFGALVAVATIEPPSCVDQAEQGASSSPAKVPWKMVALVIFPLAFLDAAGSTGAFLLQTTGDRGPVAVTVLVAVITLASAAGSVLATRLPAIGARMQLTAAPIGALLVAVALTFPAALVAVTVALSFGTGVLHPLRAAAIQRLARDDVRAQAASAASACDMALSTMFLLLAGSVLVRRRRAA